jgi:hypothetical protein
MYSYPRRRGIRLMLPVLWIGAFLALSPGGVAAATSSRTPLAGTWSGKYSGAFSGTFKIHWKQTGSKLRGSIALSNPRGTYSITGSVRGSAIKFGAVGAGATYTGSVSGKSMSGNYKSPQGGGPWSADKTS